MDLVVIQITQYTMKKEGILFLQNLFGSAQFLAKTSELLQLLLLFMSGVFVYYIKSVLFFSNVNSNFSNQLCTHYSLISFSSGAHWLNLDQKFFFWKFNFWSTNPGRKLEVVPQCAPPKFLPAMQIFLINVHITFHLLQFFDDSSSKSEIYCHLKMQ